uniref:PH domain-containing protein n=2 Tax=Arion vulgaris TaxID=1028688 RepID=A0A0B7ASU2_9EUPU
MSSYHEPVKRILSEFNRFLKVTLQSETLSTNTENERNKILKLLQKLFADYDSLVPNYGDEGSVSSTKDGSISGSLDESRNTVGSIEEDSNADNISDTTVKALSQPAKIGYLEVKQEKLFISSWQKRYCVIHENIFYIFKKPEDKKQLGAFLLTGYELREAPHLVKGDRKKDCCFELVCPGKKSYQFLSESKEDLQAWRKAMEVADKESDGDIYEEFNEPVHKSTSKSSIIEEMYDEAETVKPKHPPVPMAIVAKVSPVLSNVAPAKPAAEVQAIVVDDDDIYEPFDRPEQDSPPKQETILPKMKRETLSSASNPPPMPSHLTVASRGSEAPPPSLPPHRGQEPQPPLTPQHRDLPQLPQGPPPLPGRALPPPPPTSPLPAVPQSPKMTSPSLGKILHPSEDFENLFYGKWDCNGSTDNELSFRRGQIVHVISRDLDKDDWWVGALNEKIGLVPKTYLCPAYELIR